MWNDKVTLVFPYCVGTDDIGQAIVQETKRMIFAIEKPVTNAMLFYASQFGFKPTLVLHIHSYEYQQEPYIEYRGLRYVIKRVYQQSFEITEIQCELAEGQMYVE